MIKNTFLMLVLLLNIVNAREVDSLLSLLKTKFASFEYQDAINISTDILIHKDQLEKSDLLEVYRIKSVAYYSQGNENSAEDNFIAILDIDSSYVLDTIINSPKIVAFFNDIRERYLSVNKQKEIFPVDIPDREGIIQARIQMRNSLLKSLIFPGWGHFSNGANLKGGILSTLFITSVGSLIYFAGDCSRKEKRYLTETDRTLIPSLYDKYNSAYKLRNLSIVSTILIWAYSQLDLLFFGSFIENKGELTFHYKNHSPVYTLKVRL